jgi:predicted metal-dependent enzyme (double-stranded beta helix superfamily)
METGDWIVSNEGQCEGLPQVETCLHRPSPYRLYRFLSDLDDILDEVADDALRLQQICPQVRQFLSDSPWLEAQYVPPDPKKGWSVLMLYDEPDYPLTVQMVAWTPGQVSPIHNHGCWGLVALLSGQEKNTFWRRSPDVEYPDRLEQVSELCLEPGQIVSFLPDTIHCVEALGDEPTISFNLYGKTDYNHRFEFDLTTHTAKKF